MMLVLSILYEVCGRGPELDTEGKTEINISFPEAALRVVSGRCRSYIAVGSLVHIAHLGTFVLPIGKRVLNYGQGIDPNV
jgi:hypothetical protein